jgi:hypothetical protein
MALSVLICTHNAPMDYLARALQALKEQDLPSSEWELLVIDNASERPVREICDVSWHPNFPRRARRKIGSSFVEPAIRAEASADNRGMKLRIGARFCYNGTQ